MANPRPMRRPPAVLARIGGGVVVVGASTWVAVRGLPGWEEELFDVLNSGPSVLEPVLWAPMQMGSLFGPFIVAAGAWWRWRTWRPTAGAVVAGVVAWQVAKVLKAAVERGRPFEMLDDFARLGGTPYEGLGFVSGHAAVAFSLASVLSPYLDRRNRTVAYALAAVVGLARIHVSAHLPLDVVGGAALGYTIGWCWNLAVGVPAGDPQGLHSGE